MLGDPESNRLKVAALPSPKRLRAGRSKSFPPDRLSPFRKAVFSYCDRVSKGGEELSLPLRKGGGEGFIFEGKYA